MRTGPVKSFWLSFFLTLAVVVPVMGSFVLYAALTPQLAPAEQIQSGIPVERPGPKHVFSVFAAVAGEEPAFVLLRLDPVAGTFQMVTVPSQTVVLEQEGSITLAQAYREAGPARAAKLLGQTLGVAFDRYLAASPEVWGRAAGAAGSARVNLAGVLTGAEQESLEAEGEVVSLTGSRAARFLAGSKLEPPAQAALRAAVWQAFARQNKAALPALVESLKKDSGYLLTNVNALDLHHLARSLEYLAGAEPEAVSLPGGWNRRTGRFELGEEALALAAGLFPAPAETKPAMQGEKDAEE